MKDVAQVATKRPDLELRDWMPISETDLPQWRYREIKEGKKTVPVIEFVGLDLLRLPEEAAKGLFFQEIFRALYSNEEFIENNLKNNATFKLLFTAMNTPRLVKRGLKPDAYPGAIS